MRVAVLLFIVVFMLILGCTGTNAAIGNASVSASSNNLPEANSSLLTLPEPTTNLNEITGLPTVDFYFSPKCSACQEVDPLIKLLEQNFSGKITFRFHDLTTQQGWDDFNRYAKKFGIPDNKRYIPVLVIGNRTFTGLDGLKSWIIYPALLNYSNTTGE